MRIALTVGHSILKNGNITSANGIINEYSYCKTIAPEIKKHLEQLGASVDLIICPERVFSVSGEEKGYKLTRLARKTYDVIAELHLNAFNKESANGTEVYYKSAKGKVFADRVQKKLSTVFTDRKAQKKDNLYILNQTTSPAILIEMFFCTNKNDVGKGKEIDKIARLIAEGIAGKEIVTKPLKSITTTSSKLDIVWLQNKLNKALNGKYKLAESGIYDDRTRIAVLMFWEGKGWGKHMKDDGTKAGKSTIEELSKH